MIKIEDSNSKEFYFKGFSREGLNLIKEVRENNSKDFYKSKEAIFNEQVIKPLKCIVADMGEFMNEIDENVDITPAVGKTISRIYRDTRFAKDKSIFRDVLWIVFKRKVEDYLDTPAYFFEVSSTQYRYGMGFYAPNTATMSEYRSMIDKNESEFLDMIEFYYKQDTFVLGGENYKKSKGKGKSEKLLEWYDKKSIYLISTRDIDEKILTSGLINELMRGYKELEPLYNFFWKASENRK